MGGTEVLHVVDCQGLQELTRLAGLGNAEDDEDEAELLAKEAAMPLKDLLAKLKKVHEFCYDTAHSPKSNKKSDSWVVVMFRVWRLVFSKTVMVD